MHEALDVLIVDDDDATRTGLSALLANAARSGATTPVGGRSRTAHYHQREHPFVHRAR